MSHDEAGRTNEPSFLDNDETGAVRSLWQKFSTCCFFIVLSVPMLALVVRNYLMPPALKWITTPSGKITMINGDESAVADPAAELQGDCPSAAALIEYQQNGPKYSANVFHHPV